MKNFLLRFIPAFLFCLVAAPAFVILGILYPIGEAVQIVLHTLHRIRKAKHEPFRFRKTFT